MARDFDNQYAAAVARGARVGPRAIAVHYDVRMKRVDVELSNGMGISVPAARIEGLGAATVAQLRAGRITGHGTALRWDDLDVDVYVPALFEGVLGTEKWMSELARAAGRTRSARKAAAARENGKKGGRPRKQRSAP